jgi:hypothetical protein
MTVHPLRSRLTAPAATGALFATSPAQGTLAGRGEQYLHVHDQIVAFQTCAGTRRMSALRAR